LAPEAVESTKIVTAPASDCPAANEMATASRASRTEKQAPVRSSSYRRVVGLSGKRLLVMSSPGVGVTSRGFSWVGGAWPVGRCDGVLGSSGVVVGIEGFLGSSKVSDIANRL
jgi:hypothetical protein